jgi:hypothetical protein
VKGVGARIPEEYLMVLVIVKEMAVVLRAALVVQVARAETVQPVTIEFTLLCLFIFY